MSNEISEIFSGAKNASVNQVLFLRDRQNYSEQRGNFEATEERAWSFTINRNKEFNNDNDNVQSPIDETIDTIVHTTLDNVIEQVVSETERSVSEQKLDELSEISLKCADEYEISEYTDEYDILKCGEEEDDEDNAINTKYQNQKSLQAYNDFDENMEKETVVIEDSSSDFLPQVATNLFHTVQSCITFLISGIILWIFIKEVAKIYSPIFDFFFLEKNIKAQKIENNVNDDLDDRSKPIEKSKSYLISTHDKNGLSSNDDLDEISQPIEKPNIYFISTHETNAFSSSDDLDNRSKSIENSNNYLISTHDTNILFSNYDLDDRSKLIEKFNNYLISTHDTNSLSSIDDLDERSKPIENSNSLISTHETNGLSSIDDLGERSKFIENSNSCLISTHDTNVLSSNNDLDERSKPIEKSNSCLISTHDTNVLSSIDNLGERSKSIEKSNSYLISTHDTNGLPSIDDLGERSKSIENSNSYLISTHDKNGLFSNGDLDDRSKPIENSNNYLISTHDTNVLSSNNDLDERSKPIEKFNSCLISTHDTNGLSSEINVGCSTNDMDKSDKSKPEDYPQIISEIEIQDNQDFDEEDNILDQILDRNSDLMPIDEEVNMHDCIFDGNDDLIPTEHNLSNDKNYSHYSYFANSENEIQNNNNNLRDYISNNNNRIRYISNNNNKIRYILNNNNNELCDYVSNNNNKIQNEIHDNNNLRDYISNYNNKIRYISNNNNNDDDDELLSIEQNSPNYENQNENNNNQNIYLSHEKDHMQNCIPNMNGDLISTEQNLPNNEKNENSPFYSHFTSEENNILTSVLEKNHYETTTLYSEKQNLVSRLPQKRLRITRSKSKLQKDVTSNMSLEEKKQLLNKVRQKKMMLEKDLKTVTKENTNRNKEYLCDLDVVVVHKDGFRPPSPTTKLPIKSKKSKTTSFIPIPKSRHGRKEINDNSEENGENGEDGRGVHWDEEKLQLFSPRIMSSPSVAKQKPIPKSCLKQPNRVTDSFGNVFDANESLIPSLQRGMKVKVMKIKYQDDDDYE
ncbi:4163_t:CDS:2 [Diversispora eburnea]|uniref:4163_t:CDS:1 n=1 Tax=Diversispora eburnea TaxID=1213867 RepID=A0A9N8UXC7_9GLOM|nr:4163_t:CDS:2 [Diversispora eburnea]